MENARNVFTKIRKTSIELVFGASEGNGEGDGSIDPSVVTKLANYAMKYEEIVARTIMGEVNEYPPEDEEADIESGDKFNVDGRKVLL